jgi:hypothetical protein
MYELESRKTVEPVKKKNPKLLLWGEKEIINYVKHWLK